MNSVKLEKFAVSRGGSVDPSKHPEEVFDLYSIPAYDQYKPDVIAGNEIGSAKKIVQSGDVLLSRIVPHIRRVWVVGLLQGRRQIGSGEWIVFRGDSFEPNYLRHILMADPFHQQFMKTVSGMGGSLLRARPSEVEKIKIPLPPLPEQKRIAAILDKADSIRRKRQEAVRLTEELLRSAFLEMFGDPVTNPKGWTVVKLKDTFDLKPQIGTIVPADERGKQLVVRVGELGKVDVALDRCKSVTLSGQELKRFYLSSGDFLLARAIGSADHLGKASIFQETSAPVVFDSHVMRLRFKNNVIHSTFFYEWLKSTGGKALFMRRAGQTAVQFNVNSEQIGEIEIPLPPYLTQMKFVALFEKVRKLHQKTNCTLEGSTQLFNSLLQRAFKGEL